MRFYGYHIPKLALEARKMGKAAKFWFSKNNIYIKDIFERKT